ncbi:hypothetical protein AAVH_01272 [Aphelenchoides avenae]|nr:hypothetical protein AAVH_01272 [Aphelenchus avenae]
MSRTPRQVLSHSSAGASLNPDHTQASSNPMSPPAAGHHSTTTADRESPGGRAHGEYENWSDMRDFESRIWGITNRLLTLTTDTPTNTANNLLQTLLTDVITHKGSLSATKAEILASDLRQRIEADKLQRDACEQLTRRLADLVQDMLVYNSHQGPLTHDALSLLNKYECRDWSELDNMIQRLESEAHVRAYSAPNDQHRLTAGLDFQLLSNSDPHTEPRRVEPNLPTPWKTPTWNQRQLAAGYTPQVVGPDVVPYDGQGKRTFDEFLRDFGWRYGQFAEYVQRSCLVNLLRGYALDVFNSLEPDIQNGPLPMVLDQMRVRLTTVDQVPLNTLHAQLLRCRRETNQSITAYIVKLDLLAGQLYQPVADHERDYVEIGKANALLENVNKPELTPDLDKILASATPKDVFKEARDCALRYERLKLRRLGNNPQQQGLANNTTPPPRRTYTGSYQPKPANHNNQSRPPNNNRNGMANSVVQENGQHDLPPDAENFADVNPTDTSDTAPAFAITSQGPTMTNPPEESKGDASTPISIDTNAPIPVAYFGSQSPWPGRNGRRPALTHFRANTATLPFSTTTTAAAEDTGLSRGGK